MYITYAMGVAMIPFFLWVAVQARKDWKNRETHHITSDQERKWYVSERK